MGMSTAMTRQARLVAQHAVRAAGMAVAAAERAIPEGERAFIVAQAGDLFAERS